MLSRSRRDRLHHMFRLSTDRHYALHLARHHLGVENVAAPNRVKGIIQQWKDAQANLNK